jgi:predicted O-methyltransferase YrrM
MTLTRTATQRSSRRCRTGSRPALQTGGLLITDNTLWHARVLDPQDTTDHAVCTFNQRLFGSPYFYTTQLPIRDGVSVAIRL